MKIKELFFPLRKPYRADYNNYGDNAEFYGSQPFFGIKAHNGIDALALNPQSLAFVLNEFPVYASQDEKIIKAERDKYGGWIVEGISLEKDFDENWISYFWKTTYYHLKEIKALVGQIVKAGDLIAIGDASGWAPPERPLKPHLHYHIKVGDLDEKGEFIKAFPDNGYRGAVDPMPYMSKLTAYELRTSLIKISEAIELLGRRIMEFIKSRK